MHKTFFFLMILMFILNHFKSYTKMKMTNIIKSQAIIEDEVINSINILKLK